MLVLLTFTLFDGHRGDPIVEGGEHHGLVLRTHVEVLDHLVEDHRVVPRKVLYVVTLHHLVVLLHQGCGGTDNR